MDGDMSGAQGTYLALASSLVLLLQRGLLPLFIPLGTPTSGKEWRVGARDTRPLQCQVKPGLAQGPLLLSQACLRYIASPIPEHRDKAKMDLKRVITFLLVGELAFNL